MTLTVLGMTCLPLNPSGENGSALTDEMLARHAVLEADNPYVPDTAPGQLLEVIERPGGRAELRIYDLAP